VVGPVAAGDQFCVAVRSNPSTPFIHQQEALLSPSSSSPGISFSDLRTRLAGRVIEPGDDGYDDARVVFYGAADSRPAVIAKVANATDVALVVRLARDTGLELAIRSGGHSGAGHGTTDGGIVLDLSDMKAIESGVRRAYPGPTRDRLAEIKRRYDPTNLFRRNQNIAPAAEGARA
jgi:FAD/FMN-containing dehydrogenase